MTAKDILMKYTKVGLDGLNKVGETISAELNSVSWKDIKSLSKKDFNAISLPLLYDWAHITGQGGGIQNEITKLAIKHKSDELKYQFLLKSKLYDSKFENIVKTIIEEQKASISMLQRVFKLHFPKAKEYIDELLELGFIKKNGKYYKVVIKKEYLDLDTLTETRLKNKRKKREQMINSLSENKLYDFESEFKVEIKATFYSLLYHFLYNGEKVLLIKYNHSNAYQKLFEIASLNATEKRREKIVDHFRLTQVELYNKSLMSTFDIIKKLGESVDRIFIEKPSIENEYKYYDYLKEINKSVYVLPNTQDGELYKHSDYSVKIDEISNGACVGNFVLSCESENSKQTFDITFENHCLLKLRDNN